LPPKSPVGERGWGSFATFVREHLFEKEAELLATIARQRVEQPRGLFPDPFAAASYLSQRAIRTDEASIVHTYHIGCAAALCGDPATAHHAFSTVAPGITDPGWARKLGRVAAKLRRTENAHLLRRRVEQLIHATCQRLGLPPLPSVP
jgi:hypothetical protein